MNTNPKISVLTLPTDLLFRDRTPDENSYVDLGADEKFRDAQIVRREVAEFIRDMVELKGHKNVVDLQFSVTKTNSPNYVIIHDIRLCYPAPPHGITVQRFDHINVNAPDPVCGFTAMHQAYNLWQALTHDYSERIYWRGVKTDIHAAVAIIPPGEQLERLAANLGIPVGAVRPKEK